MDLRRGQPLREAVVSSSGRHSTHRPCSAGALRLASLQRQYLGQRDLSGSLPPIACRAGQGSPQPQTATIQPVATTPNAPPAVSSYKTSSPSPSSSAAASPPPPSASAATSTPPAAASNGTSASPASAAAAATVSSLDPFARSANRVKRLTALVETRRLYRNCIRAEYLLSLASPLYTAPAEPQQQESERQQQQQDADATAASPAVGVTNGTGESGDGVDPGSAAERGGSAAGALAGSLPPPPLPLPRGPSLEEDKALKAALETVAEMALVSEQLKASLRYLPSGFGSLVFPSGSEAADEEAVREVARRYSGALRERLAAELPLLPITGDAALHYIESRNAKYSRRVAWDELQGASGSAASREGGAAGPPGVLGAGVGSGAAGAGGAAGVGGASEPRASPLERLEAAERVAGEIIANSIKPALKKASEQDLVEVVRGTGSYLKGLWVRLNGGQPADGRAALAAMDLPLPVGTQEQSELAISQLSLDLEALEKKLQEASKNRENKLRKAGLQGRVQMAIQLKGLDAEVLQLSSQLAVRTLQLEMEHVYGSLEAEALDVANGVKGGGLLARDGSTNELSLLVAEFALLDEQLTLLAAALEGPSPHPHPQQQAGGAAAAAAVPAAARAGAAAAAAAAAASAVATAAASMGPALISDEVLGKLAADIPDMRSRVGVADQTVFGGPGFSLTKARLQLRESLDKVREGVTFLSRGMKLLASDIATAARLFLKAALGNSLKPREVSALRRTARDLLTFIPFTIILIIPLSPLGHVLVFGFIQRYFPSFFPSQFSTRRQDIMVRYDELERQLLEAQATAEAAEEEVELARAREAVARLTAPEVAAAAAGGEPAASTGVADTASAAGAGTAHAVGGGSGAVAGVGGSSGGVAVGNGAGVGTGGGGGGGSGGPAPAALSSLGLGAASSTLSSVDEVTLHEATQKVKKLAEQLDEIRDTDMAEGESSDGSGKQH